MKFNRCWGDVRPRHDEVERRGRKPVGANENDGNFKNKIIDMGKCRSCGKETTGKASSIISDSEWYLCEDCFNKENGGTNLVIMVFGVLLLPMILVVLALVFGW